MQPEVLVIVGPTASGKTDFAIKRAKENGGAVISADSRQVYSGLNIGTAKPEEAWRDAPHAISEPDIVDAIPHYLLSVCAPDQLYSLAQWQSAAQKILEKIGQPAILVGGTMLYVDSILFNYSIPEVKPDPVLRAELEKLSAEELWQQLMQKDPAAKQFIEPHHKQRIIRALEVIAVTGKPFSDLRQQRPSPYQFKIIGLFPGWDALRERITQRAQAMLDDGLLEETKGLRAKYGPAYAKASAGKADLPLLKTMNYLQAGQLLDEILTREQALAEMVKVNMRYAHRQMNWWKRNKEIEWLV